MSLKINTPNKNSYAVTNVRPYQFPPDGNDSEVVKRVDTQDVYSYQQNYFNGSDLFGNLSATTIGPAYGGNQEWLGGVLAPNGTIYTTPQYPLGTQLPPYFVLAVNTYTNVTRQIQVPSSIPEPKGYVGGVCMPNGKIYRINIGVLIQDTNDDTFSYVPINYGSLFGGYSGCVLAPNGKIYAIPNFANNVLVFNPVDNSYKFITSPDVSDNGGRKWMGGALAPNGNIYCFPRRNATSILVINTNNDTMTASIPTLQGNFVVPSPNEGVYWGGCLAPNGKIYGAPNNFSNSSDSSAGKHFLEIDPSSNTYKYVATLPTTNSIRIYSFPTLAQDGWLYCGGDNPTSIRFNPDTYEIQQLTNVSNRRWGCTLAPNGKIYFHPRQANAFLSLKTGYPQLQPWMMAPEFNKL